MCVYIFKNNQNYNIFLLTAALLSVVHESPIISVESFNFYKITGINNTF